MTHAVHVMEEGTAICACSGIENGIHQADLPEPEAEE